MLAKIANNVADWFNTKLFIEKFNNPLGWITLLLIGLAFGILVSKIGLVFGVIAFIAVLAIPGVFGAMFNPQFGLALMLIIGFLVHLIGKYSNAPVGTSMDGLMLVMLFGMLVMQSRSKKKGFASSPISYWVLIWVGYNLLQGLNPVAESILAWVYTVRTMALLIFVYFIACFAFDSLKKIQWMIWYIILLLLGTALYGMKQEFIGFSAVEEAWIYADELRFQLLFQWTRMRIFSVTNDPTTFGIMMAFGGCQCFAMAMGDRPWGTKILLFIFAGIMFMVMAFTGTRTAYALVPIGLLMFAGLTLTRNIVIGAVLGLFLGIGFVSMSTSNALVFRIQSAFRVTEDESMQVRFKNQKIIQPFIHNHPIGAGLGTTGVWGKRFTPDSWLADFPHDTRFVRIAVEQGWIGLILYMIFLFVVLKECTYYYVRVRDPIIKNLYLGIYLVLIILTTASYPQEIIVQLPISLIFYIYLAAIVKLKDFDPAFTDDPEIIKKFNERQEQLTIAKK